MQKRGSVVQSPFCVTCTPCEESFEVLFPLYFSIFRRPLKWIASNEKPKAAQLYASLCSAQEPSGQ